MPILKIIQEKWTGEALTPGTPAPLFSTQTHENQPFHLAEAFSKGWIVLFFFPKAHTPGCTKQACAFRDHLSELKKLGAQVFGISINSVSQQKSFVEKHKLNFTLLADQDGHVAKIYRTKIPLIPASRRWTFLIDPHGTIQWVGKDVDPITDASTVIKFLADSH